MYSALRIWLLIGLLAGLLVAPRGSSAQSDVPLPGGVPDRPGTFLYDPTNLLTNQEQREINSRLIAFRDSTSNELAVLILRRVPEGEVMESFVNDVFNRWGIGNKEKNNGVLLAVFVDDRKMRIEVGSGLEPVLTDGITGRIQRETLRPAFRDKEYAKGIKEAVSQLEAAARSEFGEASEPEEPWWKTAIMTLFALTAFGFLAWFAIIMLRALFLYVRRQIRAMMGKPHDRWGESPDNKWYGDGYESNSSSSGWSSSSSDSDSSSSSDFGGGSSDGGGSSSDW